MIMQDKQTFSKNGLAGRRSSSEVSLITLERSQKLDLLIHLISNLRQSLVICGPKGIGKTTLLEELKLRKKDDWFIVDIQASANISFESFQHQLMRFLIVNYSDYESQDLSTTLSVLADQNHKVVVVIDDAALLAPGFITTLIQYAIVNVCLRIVFSLTYDELEIKKNSDRAIDDCHHIEIPPLTLKQCGIYLRNLSVQPSVGISLSEINEQMIQKLYHETFGVPGKIISELPALSNYPIVGDYKWMGVAVFIAVLVTGGIGYLIFDEDSSKVKLEKISSQKMSKKDDNFETSSFLTSAHKVKPIAQNEKTEKLEANNKEQDQNDVPQIFSSGSNIISAQKSENLFAESRVKLQTKINEKSIELPGHAQMSVPPVLTKASEDQIDIEKTASKAGFQPMKEKRKNFDRDEVNNKINKEEVIVKAVEPVQISQKAKIRPEPVVSQDKNLKTDDNNKTKKNLKNSDKNDDSSWILKQPKTNYTIQLMVLSRRNSVVEFIKKNQNLKDQLKFFTLNKQGKSKYVLIYGSFKNTATVSKEMKSLPEKFKKSWVRKFSQIQKKINK